LIIGKREFSREKNEKVLQISVVSYAPDFFKNINHFLILETTYYEGLLSDQAQA